MSNFAAGLLSGVALALVFAIYSLVRRSAVLAGFRATDESIANVPEQTLFYLVLGAFSSAAVLLGVAAGFAYGWLGLPLYIIAAFGSAIVLSLIAVVSRTAMAWDKVFWNLAAGTVLGLLIPFLAT